MLRTTPSRRKSTENLGIDGSFLGSSPGISSKRRDSVSQQMVENGYLQLQVKDLQNTTDSDLDLKNSNIVVTVDYLTEKYCKVKTLVAKGDKRNPECWGQGLYFRVFIPTREVTFEVKASVPDPADGDAPIDFGSCRFSLVPAMDTYEECLWCVMQDRFGRRNNCRMQVGWRYVTKLNYVRPSVMSKASILEPGSVSNTQRLLFTGFSVNHVERCEALEKTIERICCGSALLGDQELAEMLLLKRWFCAFRDVVYAQHLANLIETPSPYWEVQHTAPGHQRRGNKPSLNCKARSEGAKAVHFVPVRSPARDPNVSESKLNAILNLQRVYRGHIIRKLYKFAIGHRLAFFREKSKRRLSTPTVPISRCGVSFKRSSLGFLPEVSEEFRKSGQLAMGKKKLKLSKSFMLKSQIVIKALNEIIEMANPNSALKQDFESISFPESSVSGFTFKLSPQLQIEEIDTVNYLARKAAFLFLGEQIQKGVGILPNLEPMDCALSAPDVAQLMEIGTLCVYDRAQMIFEQNVESDSFGIVLSGNVRVLYNHREVSTLIRGQFFCDLGMLSILNTAPMFGPTRVVNGASFVAAERSFCLVFPHAKFLEHAKNLGHRVEAALKNFLTQSESIGRENWSAYGNSAKSIEISFLYFMSTKSGLLGLLNMVEVRALASIATYQKFHAHEYLCKQGERAGGIFIIMTGIAAVIVDRKQVAYTCRGQEVGEMGLIGDFARLRSATLIAHYDCEVAIITYENFMSFIEILSQHQAQRLAQYVAASILPKYLSNLNMKSESEAEFAVETERALERRKEPLETGRGRRMPIVSIADSPTFSSDEVSIDGRDSPRSRKSNVSACRAVPTNLNVMRQRSLTIVESVNASKLLRDKGSKRQPVYLKRHLQEDSRKSDTLIKGEAALYEAAKLNVRERAQAQTFLLPPKERNHFTGDVPIHARPQDLSPSLRMSPLTKTVFGRGRGSPNSDWDQNAKIEKIKTCMRAVFQNVREAFSAFDKCKRGSVTMKEFVDGLQQLGIDQRTVLTVSGAMNSNFRKGVITASDFTRKFGWDQLKRDEDLIKAWLDAKQHPDPITAEVSKIKEDESKEEEFPIQDFKIFSILRSQHSMIRNLLHVDEHRQSLRSVEGLSLQEFQTRFLKLHLGLTYAELDHAFALLTKGLLNKISPSDVDRVVQSSFSCSEQLSPQISIFSGESISARENIPYDANVPRLPRRPETARCRPTFPHSAEASCTARPSTSLGRRKFCRMAVARMPNESCTFGMLNSCDASSPTYERAAEKQGQIVQSCDPRSLLLDSNEVRHSYVHPGSTNN